MLTNFCKRDLFLEAVFFAKNPFETALSNLAFTSTSALSAAQGVVIHDSINWECWDPAPEPAGD